MQIFIHKKIIKTVKYNASHIRRILLFNTLRIAPVYILLSSSKSEHRVRSQHAHSTHPHACTHTIGTQMSAETQTLSHNA